MPASGCGSAEPWAVAHRWCVAPVVLVSGSDEFTRLSWLGVTWLPDAGAAKQGPGWGWERWGLRKGFWGGVSLCSSQEEEAGEEDVCPCSLVKWGKCGSTLRLCFLLKPAQGKGIWCFMLPASAARWLVCFLSAGQRVEVRQCLVSGWGGRRGCFAWFLPQALHFPPRYASRVSGEIQGL